jgi:hypothetical protein
MPFLSWLKSGMHLEEPASGPLKLIGVKMGEETAASKPGSWRAGDPIH